MNYLNKYKVNPNKLITRRTNILLRHHRMPGDILTMTPLVRDLKNTYGDLVNIKVDTPQCQDIWINNPYVTHSDKFVPDEIYNLDYDMSIKNEARGLNMAEGFRQDFIQKSGYHIIASDMWPDIFIAENELSRLDDKYFGIGHLKDKFWIISPGNKKSCQVKVWPRMYWQEIIDEYSERNTKFIQVGQSKHGHTPFEGVINFIDKTENIRDLFSLFYFSRGSIGYHSFHMHISAALRKPCIVLAGGRESPSNFKYPNHIVYSSIGQVSCCQYGGCYKGKEKTVKELCGDKVFISLQSEIIPACMMQIEPDRVIEDIKHYDKLITLNELDPYKYKLVEEVPQSEKIIDHHIEVGPRHKIFRMICNTHCYSGGERTAVTIMKLMQKEGYCIELLSASSNEVYQEFKEHCPAGTMYLVQSKPPHKADIVFFQVNDSLLRIAKNMIREDSIKKWVIGDRIVFGVNYHIHGICRWDKSVDFYICQSRTIINELSSVFQIDISRRAVVLKPPSDLSRYLSIKYNRDWSAPILIRHSSQFDMKYYNNIQEQVDNIFIARPDTAIHLMPAPTFLQDKRVQIYPYNALKPWQFLELGNIFWYFVDENKFREAGCNVVLEAMAAGLPILCNNNGGLPDVIDDHVGWCCESLDEMYSVIRNIDMDVAREKGENARKRVQEIVDPDQWVKHIIG